MTPPTRPQSFEEVARHLAEVVDAILAAERPRERRIELIKQQLRRALSIGYKAGRGLGATDGQT